jgi:hypothetical protein
VVRRQEGGGGLELRGGGAPAGYVDEPPPPRPAAVRLRHLIPFESLLQGERGCQLVCLSASGRWGALGAGGGGRDASPAAAGTPRQLCLEGEAQGEKTKDGLGLCEIVA